MSLCNLPFLGSGLGYRAELDGPIRANAGTIDWIEVITEHYLFADDERRARLWDLRGLFPIVPHGVELSIGTPGDPNPLYVEALARLVAEIGAPWFSDHLCYTRTERIALGTLVPLPRTREVAGELGRKAQRVQREVGVPFLLENIAYHVDLPMPLSEADFLTEVMEHCDCGLLLDLANLDANAANHGYDPLEFLDRIPVERVIQVHLAGGLRRDGRVIDSHSAPVPESVWGLLDALGERTRVRAALIERDKDFPDDFTELVAEVERAGRALAAVEV